PGHGSVFWIDLPFARDAQARTVTRAVPASIAGRHILIVDDTATNRLILSQSLQQFGCRVQEAGGGRAALALLERCRQADPIDLVILDLHMPELDGVATARLIKAVPDLARLPLILLSSLGGAPHGDRTAGEVGFAAVVTKPVHRS